MPPSSARASTRREGPLWPVERWSAHPATPPVRVPLRPAAVADPPAIFVPDSLSEDERYELWHERRGPNAEVVAAIGAEAAAAGYQPTISVLMPVCDTEAWMLEAAVESVLAQAYPNWQLCLADDASQRPETLAALESLARRDSRVVLTRLEQALGDLGRHQRRPFPGYRRLRRLPGPRRRLEAPRAGPGGPVARRRPDAGPALQRRGQARPRRPASPRRAGSPTGRPTCCCARTTSAISWCCGVRWSKASAGCARDYDGSQDYDLVLRVADATDRIAHIPDSLYSWRMHQKSAAAAGENKPWAWMAAQRALGRLAPPAGRPRAGPAAGPRRGRGSTSTG